VSAIEQARLTPSVSAALALARSLDCTVEQLFGEVDCGGGGEHWAWESPSARCRYWSAEVGGRRWRYPVEPTSVGEVAHDGIWNGSSVCDSETSEPEHVLVIATCDPAVALLATEYARQTPFRLLPLTRSSSDALRLLKSETIHAAGVHLSSGSAEGNEAVVREGCGTGLRLLRVGVWQEGIAFASHLKLRSRRAALASRLRWVGREAGSGARQCLDELLDGRNPPRRMAPDHRGVALAIRCGWADAGVCLRLASEEAGLGFLELRREAYDLCFLARLENDPRVRALVDVVQSAPYRRLLEALPGYDLRTTGDLSSC
jgi:molybdate-binding protein